METEIARGKIEKRINTVTPEKGIDMTGVLPLPVKIS